MKRLLFLVLAINCLMVQAVGIRDTLSDAEKLRLDQALIDELYKNFDISIGFIDTDTVGELIERGADPNITDLADRTLLHYAQTEDQTRALLAAGADPNIKDGMHQTPLHLAQTEGQTRALLAAGADPNAQTVFFQPLHVAVTEGQVRALLAAGANLNGKASLMYLTPLEYAVSDVRNIDRSDFGLQQAKALIKGGAIVPEHLKTNPLIKQAAREVMNEKIQALRTRDNLRGAKGLDWGAAELISEYVG